MYVVGLTGGIGSGKTIVSEVFKSIGIPVYNSDIEAKILMNTDSDIINKLKMIFGYNIYNSENQLDRKKLADLIFNNKDKLNTVNSIVHPPVKKHFQIWMNKQNSLYVIKETAILFESGTYKDVDKIITVSAPLSLRIKRLILRDNSNKKKIMERIKNQLNDEYKIKNSDFVINNNNEELILPQILSIHNNLLNILKKKVTN